MELTANENQTKSPTIEEVKNQIVEIFKIHPDEWPDDKQIDIQIKYVNALDSVSIKISKKHK